MSHTAANNPALALMLAQERIRPGGRHRAENFDTPLMRGGVGHPALPTHVDGFQRIAGLYLSAGSATLAGEPSKELFKLLFSGQMCGKLNEEVAISPEPGAASAFDCSCKALVTSIPNVLLVRLQGDYSSIFTYDTLSCINS